MTSYLVLKDNTHINIDNISCIDVVDPAEGSSEFRLIIRTSVPNRLETKVFESMDKDTVSSLSRRLGGEILRTTDEGRGLIFLDGFVKAFEVSEANRATTRAAGPMPKVKMEAMDERRRSSAT